MNHRTLYGIPLTAALMLAAWTLSASPARADPNQGPYVGGGVGRYDIKINNIVGLANTINGYSANDTAYQFFLGYRFVPFLALEAQYMNLGTNRAFLGNGTQLTNKIYGYAPWMVFTLPLGSTRGSVVGPLELFVKGGEYFYNYHRDLITPSGSFASASDTFNHFVYGGGIGLVVAQVVSVRLEYDELKIQDTSTSNALWLTGQFRF
jgi:opacity protein-like surface antigen